MEVNSIVGPPKTESCFWCPHWTAQAGKWRGSSWSKWSE